MQTSFQFWTSLFQDIFRYRRVITMLRPMFSHGISGQDHAYQGSFPAQVHFLFPSSACHSASFEDMQALDKILFTFLKVSALPKALKHHPVDFLF
jgi:hypothetical protein